MFDSSRAAGDMAVEIISVHPEIFQQAYDMCMSQEGSKALRAARVVQLIAEKQPAIFEPYFVEMINLLPALKHNAVKRSMLKILTFYDLSEYEDLHGKIIDYCFRRMNDSGEEIAIRAYSVMTLRRLSRIYPEITGELMAGLQMMVSNAKDTLSHWAGKMLKELYSDSVP